MEKPIQFRPNEYLALKTVVDALGLTDAMGGDANEAIRSLLAVRSKLDKCEDEKEDEKPGNVTAFPTTGESSRQLRLPLYANM